MIEVKQVSKLFSKNGGTTLALDNVNLTVRDGEILGIVGYSGAGKSTLLRLMNRLSSPSQGEVLVDGIDLAALSKKELAALRQHMGMIFQHFHLLWSRTVEGNILFALELAHYPTELRKTRVKELIDLVGLQGKETQYPATLSGGEKQRVGIARALANGPRYLLCDEATSALDPETTASILALLRDINRKLGVTMVLITHQMEVIQAIADRVVVMQNGAIVEENELIPLLMNPQSDVVKKFMKTIVDPGEFITPRGDSVYQLTYLDVLESRPIISNAIRTYDIEVNILQGKISRTGSSSYGTLYLTMKGDRLDEALASIRAQGVKVVLIK